MLVALIVFGSTVSPVFLSGRNFANLISAVIEVAIMSLPMALIIIAGEIDLSVESMLGLSASILGYLYAAGVPIELAIVVVLIVGALGGLLNGFLVTRMRPAVARRHAGHARAVPRARARGARVARHQPVPDLVHDVRVRDRAGPADPVAVRHLSRDRRSFSRSLLHGTWIGRQIYAIGKNQAASRFSGVRVARIKLWLFVLSGTVAALAGVILTARMASARADVGIGLTLVVVTIVLLGGVDIFGGRGTIPGVVLAFFTLAVLGNVLRLTNVSSDIQSIVVGLLLIVSVVIPTLARRVKEAYDRAQGGRRMPTGSVGGPGEVVSP